MTTIDTTLTEPPAGFVNHILASLPLTSTDPDEQIRAIIKETWLRAQQGTPATVQSASERYVDADVLLARKVARVRNVIRNTINKRNLEVPLRFKWVIGWGEYTVSGIYRNEAQSYQTPRYVSISKKRLGGSQIAVDARNDFISIKGENPRSESVLIPLHWLSLSDGDLSKMVRTEVRREAEKNRSEKLRQLQKEKELIERNLHVVQRKLDEMTPKKA